MKERKLYIRDNDRIYNAWVDIFERDPSVTLTGRRVWNIIRDSRWYANNQARKNFSKKKLFDYLVRSPFLSTSFNRSGPTAGTITGWKVATEHAFGLGN